jgi:hypothetical protein
VRRRHLCTRDSLLSRSLKHIEVVAVSDEKSGHYDEALCELLRDLTRAGYRRPNGLSWNKLAVALERNCPDIPRTRGYR